MSHRPLYKKTSHNYIWLLLLSAAVVWAAKYAYVHYWRFNPQQLVEESELNGKNFEVEVKEVVSPRLRLKAYLFEDKTNPIINVSLVFKNAGYTTDNDDEQGIADLTADLLVEGAGQLDSSSFKEELAQKAIELNFTVGKDDFTGSLMTTRENMQRAFELLKLSLSEPRFDDADVERIKKQQLELLRRQKEYPENKLDLKFYEVLFGNHPYARNPLGKESDIKNVTSEKLKTFVRDNLNRQNLLIGVAGDISVDETEKMLDFVFSGLKANGKINFVRQPEVKFDGRKEQIKQKTGQIITQKAVRGVSRNDKDFYPLFVANQILGGSGLTSRLSQKIREDKGLTYGVYSYLTIDDKAPLIVSSFATTAENYDEAEALFRKEWQNFASKGISEEELEKTKSYLTASYNLRFNSLGMIAEILTAMQKYNLGLDFLQKRNDYVRQVSWQEVNDAARKYFNEQELVEVIIGDFGTKE